MRFLPLIPIAVALALAGCGSGSGSGGCIDKTTGGRACGKAAAAYCTDATQITDQRAALACMRLLEVDR